MDYLTCRLFTSFSQKTLCTPTGDSRITCLERDVTSSGHVIFVADKLYIHIDKLNLKKFTRTVVWDCIYVNVIKNIK